MIALKGDDTIVTDGERVAVNRGGSSALLAGTGDVLSGMIAALISRGMDPFAGAAAAVLAHSRAGAEAAKPGGARESVIAGDGSMRSRRASCRAPHLRPRGVAAVLDTRRRRA